MSRALVLSAGGMFGAYQAGAWKALAESFRPDLVVGASVGALNGWAIAGGCSPSELCSTWIEAESADLMRLQFHLLPWPGIFDPAPLHRKVNAFYQRFRPRVPFGASLVEIPRMRAVVSRGEGITAAHLRATCAIPFGYPPERIDGKWYVDGGLLAAIPLAAAVEMGATSAVVLNALPFMPSRAMRWTVGTFRALVARPASFPQLEVLEIRPSETLGTLHDAVFWKEANIRRWIALGERDATTFAGRLRESSRQPFEKAHPERLARG